MAQDSTPPSERLPIRDGSLILSPMPLFILLVMALCTEVIGGEKGFLKGELLFPVETWHNHASCIVEAPNGDLIVCWFHGSGERYT